MHTGSKQAMQNVCIMSMCVMHIYISHAYVQVSKCLMHTHMCRCLSVLCIRIYVQVSKCVMYTHICAGV